MKLNDIRQGDLLLLEQLPGTFVNSSTEFFVFILDIKPEAVVCATPFTRPFVEARSWRIMLHEETRVIKVYDAWFVQTNIKLLQRTCNE